MMQKERDTVICDIDGTIADNSHRQHYLEGKRDWKSFFEEIENDKPILKILKKIEYLYQDGFQIIFVTGEARRISRTHSKMVKEIFKC